MLCTIWRHFYNLKQVENTRGGVLLKVELQAKFTKSNTPSWVFFTLFKLYRWYLIMQRVSYFIFSTIPLFFLQAVPLPNKTYNATIF